MITSLRRSGATLMNELTSALGMLTTLPMSGERPFSATAGRAFFPAVGVLIGGIAWAAFWVGSSTVGATMGGFLAVAALVLVTGALHLDGLADSTDGLFGGATTARRLEIMHDSRVGSYGLVAVVLVLVGDLVALAAMSRDEALAALLGAAALARLAVLALIVALPYARADGLGATAIGPKGLRDVAFGVAVTALALTLDWRHGLIAVGLVALTALGVGLLARRRIGGGTGDVYGGVLELSQLAALTAYAVRL